jgi:soluble lytic murein transglycosylase
VAGLALWLPASGRSGSQSPEDRCDPPSPPLSAESLATLGRFWHASGLVGEVPSRGPLEPRSVLLHARIAEGLSQSERVDELLARLVGDSLPELIALGARADERAGRWAAAETKYRRLLGMGDAAGEGLQRAASVRLAMVLEAQGKRDSAEAAWRRAAVETPEIADWLNIRRAELETDTVVAFATVSGARTPGAERRAELFMADRRVAAGNLTGALAVYRRYGRLLDLARVELSLGRRRSARQLADSLLLPDPTRPLALLAASFLVGNFDTLSLREYLAISRSFRAQGDLAMAERYALRATQRSDTSVTAWLELAGILSERRRLVPALDAIDSAAVRAGRRRAGLAGLARFRALAAADRWDVADTLVNLLVRAHPRDTAVARAVLLLAERERSRGFPERERQRYRTLVRQFPDAPAANLARFRLGLLAMTRGAADTALQLIASAGYRDTASLLGVAPRYFAARLRHESGDSAGTQQLRSIAARSPTTYYGVRAREMLGDTAFVVDTSLALPRAGSFPPSRARERVRLLASVGLDADARGEAEGWVTDSTASLYVLAAVAGAAAEAGFAREAIALGEAIRNRAGMVLAAVRALYPLPYRAVISAEAAEHCVDPRLLAAIIRQESRFEPRAVSRAGARGMSQVMPATGEELARRMRLGPFHPDLLFVPDYNLHLGSRYLRDRRDVDSLPLHAQLAAYNAGRERVVRWRAWPEFGDPDLFAERVAIGETRDYVRIVYANYAWYRSGYPSPPAEAEQAP